MKTVHGNGYEGIVLRPSLTYSPGQKIYKVKPVETYDVEVTGIVLGKGKYAGMLGAITTPYGNVGTGFTDIQRKTLLGKLRHKDIIEVNASGLTKENKFKNPSFVRVRWDKK